jgi:antitoxin (DNA-binding transcriptional repressor) of toxin-antitoxin stability system
MRVKIGELKDQLSHYLRLVRETSQDLEVCVRDEPVALLQSIDRAVRTPLEVVVARLRTRLMAQGLTWEQGNEIGEALPAVVASRAGKPDEQDG